MSTPTTTKRHIHIVRHGETILNDENRIRGWLDVPLNKCGVNDAHTVGKELTKEPLDIIVSGDLIRTHDTAQIISHETKKPISLVTDGLRPWNLGNYNGEKVEIVIPIMKAAVEETPDEPIDGGESFNEFKERFLTTFCEILETYKELDLALVTHTRGERVLAGWIAVGQPDDLSIDTSEMEKAGIEPGKFITYIL